ncbi:hypothetical protein KC19_7G061500 [Ceratodon purpureus]|uniref:Chorein N-terminal domain-containing protein n=1 Tax=Ceratodon purpureus TaxID=3225 RepID=A0A8T0H7Q9_CERPU|nr:hypothetical protein KC19_7G061500 [Ceratodon purpureus]
MESLLLRGLESTLRYWLKSFSREQFRLRGRSIQLYDLDVDGDALHASLGLPPTLRVTEARIRNLELRVASITNVHREPIVVEIDELNVVISEKLYSDLGYIPGTLPSDSSGDGYGYGYSDKLADGMTVRIGRVHVILETKGGTAREGTATRTPEVASITMTNLELYTTDERWQIVPLNQARDFSTNRGAIFVFKKLAWDSLSLDLLPPRSDHMRGNQAVNSYSDHEGERMRRGERILDNVSGCAFITIQRTDMNLPFGLEVQIHVPEIMSSRLRESGLQALLRFVTGITVCLNREEANVRSSKAVDEAGRTVIGLKVDDMFLSIKDVDFQLEFLMKHFQYVRASIVEQRSIRAMTQIMVGAFSLRDISVHPSCTLLQPSIRTSDPNVKPPVPAFANEKLWPKIHPFESWLMSRRETAPMICVYSSQVTPSPEPPALATQLVIQCQPLKIILQESTCLRIALLIAESVVLESAVKLPDRSLHAMYLTLKEFDLTIPVNEALMDESEKGGPFTGIRIHIAGFMVANSPFLTFRVLNLDNDSACSSIWKGQPAESNHQRWVVRASNAAIALETESLDDSTQKNSYVETDWAATLRHCVETTDLGFEAALLSGDGQPLMTFLPSGGIVRLGLSCKQCVAHMSQEQYSYVLKLYGLAGRAGEALYEMSKSITRKEIAMNFESNKLLDMVPADTAVILSVNSLELKLLATVPGRVSEDGPTLAKLLSWGVLLSVTHKKLAGAAMITSKVDWQDIRIECLESESAASDRGTPLTQDVKNHVSSTDSFSRSPDSSVILSSSDSSRASSMEREPSGFARKDPLLERQTSIMPDSYTLYPVIWVGKERGSMVPVERKVGDNDAYSSPTTPFLDINVETLIPHKKQETDSCKLQVIARVGGVRLGGSMCQVESLLLKHRFIGPRGVPGPNIKKLMKLISSGPLANMLRPSAEELKGAGVPAMLTSDENVWPVNDFDIVDIDLQFRDWLFSLEGVEVGANPSRKSSEQGFGNPSHSARWYATFRRMQFVGRGTKAMLEVSRRDDNRRVLHPLHNLTMRIEGLQAVRNESNQAPHFDSQPSASDALSTEEVPLKKIKRLPDRLPTITSRSGCDLEVCLVERGHDVETDFGMGNWLMDSFRVGLGEPVEIGGTRQELEDLREICKAEIKAARQMASAVVKLFQIEPPIPPAAIERVDQTGNQELKSVHPALESDKKVSLDKTPDEIGPTKSSQTKRELEFAEMEAAIATSQALCSKISNHMGWIKEEKAFLCWGTKVRDNAPVNELTRLQNQLHRMKTVLANIKSGKD